MIRAWLEVLAEWPVLRWLAGLALLIRAPAFRLIGSRFLAIEDYCRVVRVSRNRLMCRVASRSVTRLIDEISATATNPLVGWYLRSAKSRQCAAIYRQSGVGSSDLFRDLIVLKSASDGEKGVVLLKYARTFEAVVALFDLDRLMSRYTFVLEPCWAGYCDPSLLMFVAPGNPVVVQCFTDEDFNFVTRVGRPLVPVRLGPADWVNSDVFRAVPTQPKVYDLVMVANWGAHKRHATLFNALRQVKDRDVRVLLVGFAWAGRTATDVQREANSIRNPRVTVELLENLTQEQLADKLSRCKVFVFLTRKEGDNKALVEAMFADVPAVVHDRTIGGARSRINPATGILASDRELPRRLRDVLDGHASFSPRAWALRNTGSEIATRKLDEALRQASIGAGFAWTRGIVEKVNAPNLAYRHENMREVHRADYEFITSCLRQRRAH